MDTKRTVIFNRKLVPRGTARFEANYKSGVNGHISMLPLITPNGCVPRATCFMPTQPSSTFNINSLASHHIPLPGTCCMANVHSREHSLLSYPYIGLSKDDLFHTHIIPTAKGVTTREAYLKMSKIQFRAWEECCIQHGLPAKAPKILFEDNPKVHEESEEFAHLLMEYNILLVNFPPNTTSALQVRRTGSCDVAVMRTRPLPDQDGSRLRTNLEYLYHIFIVPNKQYFVNLNSLIILLTVITMFSLQTLFCSVSTRKRSTTSST